MRAVLRLLGWSYLAVLFVAAVFAESQCDLFTGTGEKCIAWALPVSMLWPAPVAVAFVFIGHR